MRMKPFATKIETRGAEVDHCDVTSDTDEVFGPAAVTRGNLENVCLLGYMREQQVLYERLLPYRIGYTTESRLPVPLVAVFGPLMSVVPFKHITLNVLRDVRCFVQSSLIIISCADSGGKSCNHLPKPIHLC